MPASAFTAHLDREQEKRMLARYTPAAIVKVLNQAAEAGAQAGVGVVRAATPIGTSRRPSQLYRQRGLQHGALRGSVGAAPMRRGLLGEVGRVIGPLGPSSVARPFVAARTHWLARVAGTAFSAARRASQRVLDAYARD